MSILIHKRALMSVRNANYTEAMLTEDIEFVMSRLQDFIEENKMGRTTMNGLMVRPAPTLA